MQFRCRVCNVLRPDANISVKSIDASVREGLPPGTLKEHFNYCNDRPECREAAKHWNGWAKGPVPADPNAVITRPGLLRRLWEKLTA